MKYFMKKLILKKSTEDKNHETLPIMQRVNNRTIAIGIRVLITKNARKSSGETLHPNSLSKVFTVITHKVFMQMKIHVINENLS